MRKLPLLMLIVVVPLSSTFGQEGIKAIKKWNWAEVQLRIGGYEDHFENMSLDGFQSMTRGVVLDNYIDDSCELEEWGSNVISGANIGASVTLNPFSKKRGEIRNNHSLRLGVSVNTGREAAMTYSKESFSTRRYQPRYESITFCLVENEFLLETGYLFSTNKSRVVSVYGGFGTNIGFTFGNDMMIFGSALNNTGNVNSLGEEMEVYQASSSTYFRLIFQGGINVRVFRGLGVFLETQGGGGWQVVHQGDNNSFDNCSTFFGINYDMRFRKK